MLTLAAQNLRQAVTPFFHSCWASWPVLLVGVPFESCPTEDLRSGQEVAKQVLPVCVSMVGPEGFEPPTKRL